MLAKVMTCAVVGLEEAIVEVEVDISPGLPSLTIVGLPDAAVQEAKELARTIADLENGEIIQAHHLAEAIQYRPRSQL